MLQIRDLHAYYGAIEALSGIDLDVHDGQICCIIGSNGAGKTTTMKSISGVLQRTGSIKWHGKELMELSTRQIAKKGIIHVAEGRHIFPGLTVYENLEIGAVSWHGFFGRQSYAEDVELVYSVFPRLKERRNQLGWSLSGGEQQMLAIGRALMARPKLLMLDEPSMGLAPLVIEEMFAKIVEINKQRNLTILLNEQNARIALQASHYAYVIEHGRIAFHGSARELESDSRILEAYLGKFAVQKEA